MQHDDTAARSDSRRIRTLLVEPDPQWSAVIELELSVRGQAVVICNETASALAAFNDDIFQIVLISQRLPDDSSTRFCRELRSLPGGEDVVIVTVVDSATAPEATGISGTNETLDWAVDEASRATQLQRIEQIARSQSQAHQRLAHASSEPFLVLNPNGTIREAAPVVERLLGFPPAAMTGVNAFSFSMPTTRHNS